MKALWQEFKCDAITYLKIAAIFLGLIALFVLAASACSPIFAVFDAATGYLP